MVAGVMAMDFNNGAVMLTDAVPLICPKLAVIIAVPWVAPVTRPLFPCVLLTVAFAELEDQVACEVMSWVLLSL